MKLSLVIPCYDEARNLPRLIERCEEAFRGDDAEVVLVDNGSTDATQDVLRERIDGRSCVRTIRVERNEGYGAGILAGLRAARGEVLAWTHADHQTDPADVRAGMALFAGAADPARLFVKGRRRGRPLGDTFFTVGMSVFETLLLGERLWDINAQPTMFHASFFRSWDSPPGDFSLDLYAYYLARRRGLDVRRFPVVFGRRAHGVSHWNVDWAAKRKFIRRTVEFSLQLRRSART
jgi:glycosyltransferase involved in cell wall biosynthesis